MDRNRKAKRVGGSSHQNATTSFSSLDATRLGEGILISSDEDEGHASMFQNTAAVKLFQIDKIREKILRYAIHDEEGKISPKMVMAVRRVQKSWLETTTELLQKSEHPVIELTLTKDNSLRKAEEVKRNGKLLDRFVGRFTDASRMEKSFLPFKLTLKLEFFSKENYQSLMDCFTRLGDELVGLEMTYPIDGGTMPLFTFPLLRKLSFQFSNGVFQKQAKRPNFGDNESGFWVLQGILSGCKDLKKLKIEFSGGCEDVVPTNMKFLRLPDTISGLKLGLKLKSKELEALVFQLTHLKNLRILTHMIPYEEGLFYKILERFQKSLVKFNVSGLWREGRPCPRTYVRFPLMEKLETIVIDSGECELGPGDVSELQRNLPNLSSAEMTYQTEPMLTKWFQNLNGKKVKSLTISMVDDDERLEHEDDNFYKSISLEMMTQVHTGFPSLRSFCLDLNISDLTVLKYLFEKMNYLKSLQINLQGNLKENASLKLTSVFLGIPVEVLNALSFLETFELKNDRQSCIRNLSELRNLTLWSEWSAADTEGEQTSLISDLLFSHGFLKMPKLRNLYFYGKFKPSPKMEKEWNDLGLRMGYTAQAVE